MWEKLKVTPSKMAKFLL